MEFHLTGEIGVLALLISNDIADHGSFECFCLNCIEVAVSCGKFCLDFRFRLWPGRRGQAVEAASCLKISNLACGFFADRSVAKRTHAATGVVCLRSELLALLLRACRSLVQALKFGSRRFDLGLQLYPDSVWRAKAKPGNEDFGIGIAVPAGFVVELFEPFDRTLQSVFCIPNMIADRWF